MKTFYISLIMVFLASQVLAETYLIYDNSTKEIISLSPEDDAVMEEGWIKVILPDEFKDIELQEHPIYYKYKNKKLVKNIEKISKRELKKQEKIDAALQSQEDFESAKVKLVTLGLTDAEVESLR